MFNIAYRILNQREEAEDILQEAFIEVFKKIETFRGDSSFGWWFKRIVINKSLNQIKKKKTWLVELTDHETEDETHNDENGADYTIEKVQNALELLPKGFRIVFTLHAFEGLKHKEIAEHLGISESTSKSQYNRAKNRIRTIIMDQHG